MLGDRVTEKLLVANRGEIAIRAFRAAYELGYGTVAVYAWEDRKALHRQKADEAYQIGRVGAPVRSYLDIAEIIRVATDASCHAVYPGYGLLSENPDLARACDEVGLVFVGPSGDVLALAGDKYRAIQAARAAGLPVLRSTPPTTELHELEENAEAVGFPLFVKAAAGGGGRGLRLVSKPAQMAHEIASAMREAEGAFGDSRVFLEEALVSPRHIEVQVLADARGDVVHLFERDCSLQRRHQKVVEIAPAPQLDRNLRDRLCADAVLFAQSIGYCNAGTVEFLVDPSGRHVFIEMNPRIQVEHTVTEEVTDVDLVRAQLLIASGATLADLGLTQEAITLRGAALQCRITTEDPANGFRPETGRLTAYRAPGGAGIRLDSGSAYPGAEISPYFDSLLVKLTCRGTDLAHAAVRARRALAEFRIRGVATNLAFLRNVLASPEFLAAPVTTGFLDDHPELTKGDMSADRASRVLSYLADVTVNRPYGEAPSRFDPRVKLPPLPQRQLVPIETARQRLRRLGPDGFARWLRSVDAVQVTDTTLRDAHQSLLATRMRTFDILASAAHSQALLPGLLSLEAWGGATFDVALRFLLEDPWQRLLELRELVPELCLQMLLRGRNTVGYTPYPDAVCRAFVDEAASSGIDIFRIFDALNDVAQMRPAIDAAREAGALVEGALCYTGDVASPAEDLYTIDYYLRIADELVEAGAHVICIKDMAGLLRPRAAVALVTALRDRFDAPVHLHTHDTAGGQLATYLAAVDAGVDAIDGAMAPLAGLTSQPSLGAIVAALANTDRATGLDLDAVCALEPYWEAARALYRPFEAGLTAPTTAVYRHEIPGGQLSNLRQQAVALGLGDRFETVTDLYATCDKILGRIIKVTPTSKVVGDLALALAASGVDPNSFAADPSVVDLPDSVIRFFEGELGTPLGGWPEPFRTRVLQLHPSRREPNPRDWAVTSALEKPGPARRELLNRMLFPAETQSFADAQTRYGDLSRLSTDVFFYGLESLSEAEIEIEAGKRLIVGLEAIGEPDARGERTVWWVLNGQTRPTRALDRSVAPSKPPVAVADPLSPGHVGAPFHGMVTVTVREGDCVEQGDVVALIEAMKMESRITAPISGEVETVHLTSPANVQAGDLLLIIRQ